MLIVADTIVPEARLVARIAAAGLASTAEAAARVEELVRDGLLLRHGGKILCPIAFETPASESDLREWLARLDPALSRTAGYDLTLSDSIAMSEPGTGRNGPSHARSGA
jgi:hypothetical protein